ncbi:hypothetical protein LWI28_007421 [Acer negundo]|uniref:Uncharacterized protein n=1 Tax=Acer negundo TaxID=4023 RepID=A0AAD5IBW6_ACENE|nr:hypothetical protein LWI28_007421 [Acer negundo]
MYLSARGCYVLTSKWLAMLDPNDQDRAFEWCIQFVAYCAYVSFAQAGAAAQAGASVIQIFVGRLRDWARNHSGDPEIEAALKRGEDPGLALGRIALGSTGGGVPCEDEPCARSCGRTGGTDPPGGSRTRSPVSVPALPLGKARGGTCSNSDISVPPGTSARFVIT